METAKFKSIVLGAAKDAEDFAQDVALKLIEGTSQTVTQMVIDLIRHKYGRWSNSTHQARRDLNNPSHIIPLDLIVQQTHPGETPYQKVSYKHLIEDLKPMDRLLIGLYYKWGFTMEEIGDLMGVTNGAVCQRISILLDQIERKIRRDEFKHPEDESK